MVDEQDKQKLSLEPPKLFGRKKKGDDAPAGTGSEATPPKKAAPKPAVKPAVKPAAKKAAPAQPAAKPADAPTATTSSAAAAVKAAADKARAAAAKEPETDATVVMETVADKPVAAKTTAPAKKAAPAAAAKPTPAAKTDDEPAPVKKAAAPAKTAAAKSVPAKKAAPAAAAKPTPAATADGSVPVKKAAPAAAAKPAPAAMADEPVPAKKDAAPAAVADVPEAPAKPSFLKKASAKLAETAAAVTANRGQDDAEGGAAVANEAPLLTVYRAAALTGLVVGSAMVVLTWLALRGCEAVRGTSSCGGGPGFILLVATFALCVLLGSALLKAFLIPDPGSSSFLAVGLVAVVALLFLINVLDSWVAIALIPLLSIGGYLASVWVTKTFVEPADS